MSGVSAPCGRGRLGGAPVIGFRLLSATAKGAESKGKIGIAFQGQRARETLHQAPGDEMEDKPEHPFVSQQSASLRVCATPWLVSSLKGELTFVVQLPVMTLEVIVVGVDEVAAGAVVQIVFPEAVTRHLHCRNTCNTSSRASNSCNLNSRFVCVLQLHPVFALTELLLVESDVRPEATVHFGRFRTVWTVVEFVFLLVIH